MNTCSVTAVSDQKSRQVIHGVQRKHPGAVVAVCGCYPQTHADDVRRWGGPDLRHRRPDGFYPPSGGGRGGERQIEAIDQPLSGGCSRSCPPAAGGRTRAMLKVEDGCVNFCTYCIIPYARGRVRSLPVPTAVEQTRALAAEGLPGDRGDGHRDLLLGPGPKNGETPDRPTGRLSALPHRLSASGWEAWSPGPSQRSSAAGRPPCRTLPPVPLVYAVRMRRHPEANEPEIRYHSICAVRCTFKSIF